jgi:hypothetical protein
VAGVMLSSRRQFLVAAGLGAAMTVIGTACSNEPGDSTAGTGGTAPPVAGVLDGVRAEVRRDPG